MKGRSGFSLAEVFISIVLFALVVGVFAETINNSTLAYSKLGGESDDKHFAKSIRAFILKVKSVDEIEEGGEFEVQGKTVYWKAEVEQTEVLDLFRLEFLARYTENNFNREIEQVLYLYRPMWSDRDERSRLKDVRLDQYEDMREANESGL